MKFYKRFPGDITIKTGHLTPSQFGCYDRLLDHYYATEKPIPANGAYSICRAVTPADRHACDSVLGEFFVLTGAGWEQQRAEEMIAEALPRIEAAKANGKLGGRPKGSIKKPTGLILETQGATQTADLQKGSQSQSSSLRSEVSKTSSSHPPAGGFADFWLTWPKSERKQDKAKCLEHWQRHCLAAIAETIIADVRELSGSATYDPASLADGAGATTTVTVTGAALGDYVDNLSFSNDLQGVILSGYVSAANTVAVRFQNESGGVLDLASGTIRVIVRKK